VLVLAPWGNRAANPSDRDRASEGWYAKREDRPWECPWLQVPPTSHIEAFNTLGFRFG
jgi:hypothetical protein